MTGPGRGDERTAEETALDAALAAMLPPGVRAASRTIRRGDRTLLLPEEAASISSRKDDARDASGAARHVARELLGQAGLVPAPIVKAATRAPIWPEGVVGSMAHDDDIALAAVAAAASFAGLGIDIEPADPLADEVAELVRMPADVLDDAHGNLGCRLLFSAKEAVYKATFPLHQAILGFEDVTIDFKRGEGRTRAGHRVQLVWCISPRIVVLAFGPVGSG